MSGIYKALKKSDGSQPNLLVQLIDGDQQQEAISGAATPATPERPVSHFASSGGTATAVALERDYRVVPLRIPAGIPIFPFDGADVKAAEQYRMLRTNLLQYPSHPRLIAVTSATSGDGKTITSINLAATLALKGDLRVLIVDADLRCPCVADAMGIDAKPGLGEVLNSECALEDAIVRVEQLPSLHVLPAGSQVSNPVELLDSARCRAVFASLLERFSYVIVDTTPVATVADFKLVHEICQGTIMVVRPDHTKRPAFLRATQVELKDKLLGLVVNAYSDWFLWKKADEYKYYGQAGR